MRLTYLSALLFIIIFSFSCKRASPVEAVPEDRVSAPCGEAVQANASNFDTAPTDAFIITHASITGDCLTVTLGLSSACAGPAIKVLHAPSVAAVYPPQHLLKIALQYGSDCAMPGSGTYSFDLYPIRQKNTNKISVNISGSAGYYKTLTYSY
ncbi:hypothetical protein [Niabella aquatica]